MAKIERTTNGAATKKTFEDKGTLKNPMWHGPKHILVSEFSVCLSITVTPTKTDKVDSISLLKISDVSDNISYFDQFNFSSQFDQ